jgi:hypothetical protein
LVCTEDLTSGEITGTWMPSGENTLRVARRTGHQGVARVEGRGARLVLDEVDRASGDALATLLAITDSPASARWRNPDTLEWVRPGDGLLGRDDLQRRGPRGRPASAARPLSRVHSQSIDLTRRP